MLQLDAAQVAARLDRLALIDALEQAFRGDCHAPHREHYSVGRRDSGASDGGDGSGGDDGGGGRENMLLVMPAWRSGGCIGVKLVTVFPGNSALGHPSVHGTYSLFDGATGRTTGLTGRHGNSRDGERRRRRHWRRATWRGRIRSRLLMVGTGALATHVIESHARVRPIKS